MNHSCEMWSRPWHALQKNLAAGLGGDLPESSAAVLKALDVRGVAKVQAGVKTRSFAVPANSWLSRVRHPTPPAAEVRQ
jgi:hypothetical protein